MRAKIEQGGREGGRKDFNEHPPSMLRIDDPGSSVVLRSRTVSAA